jgi:hypothetical protein
MLKIRHRAAFAALACVCVLAACDDAPPAPQGPAPAASTEPLPKTVNLPKDMVAAVSAGKTSSIISLHFALRATPTVNQALPVEVAIVPHRDFASLSAHFDSQESLATASGDNFGPATGVTSETPITHQLVLFPTREGMFMVTSSIETESAEGNVTRIFSIPVIVAPAAAASPPPEPVREPDKK